jgi:hypothetical protein
MSKKIWKMCVVALILASPAICSAVDIAEAVAEPNDGMYVEMAPGSSITLSFGRLCGWSDPEVVDSYSTVVLKLQQPSRGIKVEFFNGSSGPLYSPYYEVCEERFWRA